MYSPPFESAKTRHALLRIFKECRATDGSGTLSAQDLGLWSTFLHNLGMEPDRSAAIRHDIAEMGFLNVAFDGPERSLEAGERWERKARESGADCLLVPCVRDGAHAGLHEMGYVALPSFMSCSVTLESAWREHLRATMKPKTFRHFMAGARRTKERYETRWLTLAQLLRDDELFREVSRIYSDTTRRFRYPAVHFCSATLARIGATELADRFWFGLMREGESLVAFLCCFVDQESGYVAGLVHGIDYSAVAAGFNLYNHLYRSIYELMEQRGLVRFDMGRGFVEHKLRMGADCVDLLHTYLKPLNASAERYAAELVERTRGIPVLHRKLQASCVRARSHRSAARSHGVCLPELVEPALIQP